MFLWVEEFLENIHGTLSCKVHLSTINVGYDNYYATRLGLKLYSPLRSKKVQHFM